MSKKKKKLDELDKELDLFSLQQTEYIDMYMEANSEAQQEFIERNEEQIKAMPGGEEAVEKAKLSIEEQLRQSRERIMRLKKLSTEMLGMNKDTEPEVMTAFKPVPQPNVDKYGFRVGIDPYAIKEGETTFTVFKTNPDGVTEYLGRPNTDIPFPELIEEMAKYYNCPVLEEKKPTIHLTILGEPKAQKRHRSVKMGNFVRQYDPSAKDKDDLLYVVQQQAPKEPISAPIRLSVEFYFTRPKSHYRSGKNSHLLKDSVPVWHTSKPDADNCLKLVQDSLNKVFWRDDNLICDVKITKRYDTNPRIEIFITPL